jgi:hypothetical protein
LRCPEDKNAQSDPPSRLDLAEGPSDVTVPRETTIAVGYSAQPNAAALILGPTGLAYDNTTDMLFVASTVDNATFADHMPGKRYPRDQGRPCRGRHGSSVNPPRRLAGNDLRRKPAPLLPEKKAAIPTADKPDF